MVLSNKQKNLIAYVDFKVKEILENGGDETGVLIAMVEKMPEIHDIIETTPEEELQIYLNEYNGFYNFVKMLETLAIGIRDGHIKVP